MKCPECNGELEIKRNWYCCKNCDFKISKRTKKLLDIYTTALDCPYCERKGFKGIQGLNIHIAQKHKRKLQPDNIKELQILKEGGEEELNKAWRMIERIFRS